MSESPLLSIQDVSVWYPVRAGVFNRVTGHVKAVDHVSVDIAAGETLGLVGESGCGKTTLGRAILRLERKHGGRILFEGRDPDLAPAGEERRLRRRMQMVFQDPYSSLNPRMSALDLVTEGIVEHRLEGWQDKDAAGVRLMQEVGLDPDSRFRYPHEFSGGQRQRLSIARALGLRPRLLVCDEPVSALDVSVQAQIVNLLCDLRERHRLTYLFISHDLGVVRLISRRVAVMYLGRLVEIGGSEEVFAEPLHPYSRALVSAVPRPGVAVRRRILLRGEPPSPSDPPPGCPFHPRCPFAEGLCRAEAPELREVDGRLVACHLAGRIGGSIGRDQPC